MGMIRIEIVARDKFWHNALFVEWNHQFPDRPLREDLNGFYLIETEWLEDLNRVGKQCFSKIVVAPDNPSRRSLFKIFRKK
jgi:hypothetical protein